MRDQLNGIEQCAAKARGQGWEGYQERLEQCLREREERAERLIAELMGRKRKT